MKELHQKKMVAITHATAEGFQEAFYSAIANLGTSHYELQFNVNACISFTIITSKCRKILKTSTSLEATHTTAPSALT